MIKIFQKLYSLHHEINFSYIIVGSFPLTLAYWTVNSKNEIGTPKLDTNPTLL
jgi:hypothetical protein